MFAKAVANAFLYPTDLRFIFNPSTCSSILSLVFMVSSASVSEEHTWDSVLVTARLILFNFLFNGGIGKELFCESSSLEMSTFCGSVFSSSETLISSDICRFFSCFLDLGHVK